MIKRSKGSGRVIAFEPQKFLYTFLSSFFNSSKYPQVTIERYALSDKEATTSMIIPDNGKASAPGASIHFTLKDLPSAKSEEVQTISLDNYCSIHNLKPALIKIDVEGHELTVIKGALKTLTTYKPKIIIECEALQVGRAAVKETFNQVLSAGYKGFFYFKGSKYNIADFNEELHQPEKFTGKKSKAYCSNFFFL
jgi:FkbM family methyltransferase